MGECAWYEMSAWQNGAMEYHGIANVPRIGWHNGAINPYTFDKIAGLIHVSGFLELPFNQDSGMTTVGDYEITVVFGGQELTFKRDWCYMPPQFWAVFELMELMLESAKWGDEAYEEAIASYASKSANM